MLTGFLGGLANAGAIAQGQQDWQRRNADYQLALQQLAAEQRRQLLFQQQQAAMGGLARAAKDQQIMQLLGGTPQTGQPGAVAGPNYQPGAVQAQPLPPPAQLSPPPQAQQALGSGQPVVPPSSYFGAAGIPGMPGSPSGPSVAPGMRATNQLADTIGMPTRDQPRVAANTPLTFQDASGGRFDATVSSGSLSPVSGARDEIRQSLPPEQQQKARDGAVSTAGMMPPQMVGRISLPELAQIVDRTSAGESDVVKGMIISELYPLMSKEAQAQFKQQFEAFKLGLQEQDKSLTRDETRREHDLMEQDRLARERETHQAHEDLQQYRQDQLAQGKAADWEIVSPPGGTPIRVNKRTGETYPLNVPEGTSRLTGTPRSAPAMALRTFMDEYTKEHGQPPGSAEIKQFQAGMAESTAEGRTVGVTSANLDIASNKAAAIIPLLKEKAHEIDLGRFPDINSLILAYETRTGDPAVVQYGELVNALRYTYAQVLARGGQPRVNDVQHFDEIFNKAWGTRQVDAALDQIQITIDREKAAVRQTKVGVGGGQSTAETKPEGAASTPREIEYDASGNRINPIKP